MGCRPEVLTDPCLGDRSVAFDAAFDARVQWIADILASLGDTRAITGNGARTKKPRIPSSVDRVGLATWRSALSCSLRAASSGSLATTRPVTRSSKRDHGIRPSADSAARSST